MITPLRPHLRRRKIQRDEAQTPAGDCDKDAQAATLVDLVIDVAVAVGEDRRGKNGLVGYVSYLAMDHPKTFAERLLVPALIERAKEQKANPEIVYRTSDEIHKDIQERGLTGIFADLGARYLSDDRLIEVVKERGLTGKLAKPAYRPDNERTSSG